MSAADPSTSDQKADMQPPPLPPEPEAKPRRKSSFSDALNKFTSNTFNRRRTTTTLPSSTSLVTLNTQSRLPTPAGIPRSSSFFSTLNTFALSTSNSSCKQIKLGDNNSDNKNNKDHKASASKSTSTLSVATTTSTTTNNNFGDQPHLAPSHRVQTPFRHVTDLITPTNTHKPKCMISKRRESNVQITQRQLMQPLGPPVPRSKTMGALLTGSPASVVGSGSTSKRNSGVRSGSGGGGSLGENEDEEASPLAARGKTIDQVWEGDKPLPEFRTNVRQVKEAQPYSYWCGRFSALNDRFRMEDISDSSTTLCTDSSSHTNHHPMSPKVDDEERRIRRVFIHLNSLCLTEEAKASLREFQIAFEKKEAKGLMAGVAGDASLREKTSFFDKLMGKRKGSG